METIVRDPVCGELFDWEKAATVLSYQREHFIISVASVAVNVSSTLQLVSLYPTRCYWAYPRNPSLLGYAIFYLT